MEGRNHVMYRLGVHVPGEGMWFSGQASTAATGVISSLCHRCISLEYLWFYTRVTQLCVFAFTLKQRHDSWRSFRKRSATIVTKVISRVCGAMQDLIFMQRCCYKLIDGLSFLECFLFALTCLHAGVWCNAGNSRFIAQEKLHLSGSVLKEVLWFFSDQRHQCKNVKILSFKWKS